MISLNPEQRDAVRAVGNTVVTACPGSGKTRVLAARVIRALGELSSHRERVIALTFTNRAADEIEVRLDQEDVPVDCLWAGTIHSFALEWILRPYAPYCEELRRGFTIADEFYTEQLMQRLRREAELDTYAEISTVVARNGHSLNTDLATESVFRAYKAQLRASKLIDYDDVLFLAYRMLADEPEIASTLGAIVRVICVDEVQDIQDLQYGILSKIYMAATTKPTVYFVGDEDQSIYESLGATTKTPEQIASEFGLDEIEHFTLHGNYRSTQRIIDLYRQFRPAVPLIEGRAKYASEHGLITFDNQTIAREDLSTVVAHRVAEALRQGVRTNDICVIAPQWWHVKSLARQLVNELPGVDFDAPGLSPLHSSRDNFWFKIARLVLTKPTPNRTRTRGRWAREALADLSTLAAIELPENISTARRLLRMLNGLSSGETAGLAYLQDIFSQFLEIIKLDVEKYLSLKQSYDMFFEKAENRLTNSDERLPSDVESFRRLFSHPAGVVVNTCHGVKGEEYDTVIAFGLLRGYIPNWNAIIRGTAALANDRESKLLYVICSRAKRRLHLIAETGRLTQSRRPYETSWLLEDLQFDFDER
jgi:superfamily I DNA/RNA helicase